jgi:nucleoside 2-deoxyribosyltransferase
MMNFAKELETAGICVKYPGFETKKVGEDFHSAETQTRRVMVMGWTYNHFQLIRQADYVFVFNKDDYCGHGTTLEIGFAAALGKPIIALEADSDLSRDVLYYGYAANPKQFLEITRHS